MACTEFDTTLGLNLRRAREAAGLSQQQLADRLEIPQTAVSRFENGVRAMPAHFVHTLAQALKVPVEFFYEDETNPLLSAEEKLQELNSELHASPKNIHWVYWIYRLAHPKHEAKPKRKS